MATAAGQKEKKREETDWKLMVNEWLNRISDSRFRALDVNAYEAIGKKSLAEKQQGGMGEKRESGAEVSKLTPGRALNRMVVERKPGQESYVNRIIDLAEQFELAAQGERTATNVNFRRFVIQKG